MSGGLIDKVYIGLGLDNAPAAFDIKGRILGPNGTNLEYIRSETGVLAVLKNDKFEPLHLALHHTRSEALAAARSLAQNLIETIRAELAQWSAAQAGGPPPAMNVPPPTLTTTSAPSAPLPVPPPVASVTMSTPQPTMTTPQSVIPPVVSVAPASTPLMTVRQPTVLQLLPQQQYVLNQENGQLIPIVQPGMQVSNSNFTSLPIGQSLGIQQPNFGTQLVDLSSMQPVNVTQLRLSGVPSSMSMILPNGFTLPQASLGSADTTTVSSATSTPVVCAAQSTNASQKILYSTDKGDKEIKYIQGADTVQWTMPGSQTMLIPYQQLQDLASNQSGLANLQPQQFVSIAPAGGLPQSSLPLSAAQFQQLQASGTIMQLNQKPIVSSGSLINIISTGQASSPQIISSSSTPTKNVSSHEQRGQKRLSDGTPNQLQLRPIAPAGSHVSQDKAARDARTWNSTARDSTVVSMGMKINPAHGTIIHVSSGQQTNVSASGITQDGTGMYIRQIDRNAIQIQSKDGQKQDITTSKVQGAAQNVQMITVPQGMTVLQNPLNISQMPTVIGQPNSQVYMIPANHPNLVQNALPPGLIGQQVLQPGQNVTVMQPNQLGMPGGVQYNVPLMPVNMPANSQYMQTGINLNTQLSAQQLNAALAGQQLANQNLAVSGTIPIVQAPPPSSPMSNPGQALPGNQQPVHQIVQNSFVTPTSQYTAMPPQYMMQPNSGAITVPPNNPNVQYSLPATQTSNPAPNNGNGQATATSETDAGNGSTNQTNYITSSQENYMPGTTAVQNPPQQNFAAEGTTTQPPSFTPANQTSQQNYASNGNNQTSGYSVNQTPTSQPAATYNPNPSNGSNPQSSNQNYGANPTPNAQNASQGNFSPSTTPAPNQNYPAANLPSMPNVAYPPNQNPQNPYPNATGQNLAAYANNQYQYTSRPWFRPRYGSPQGSPYSSGAGPPNGPPMPPMGSYNYWPDS